MTLTELAERLEPIAIDALKSHDPFVLRIAVVFATIMGSIDHGDIDAESLDALVHAANYICKVRIDRENARWN